MNAMVGVVFLHDAALPARHFLYCIHLCHYLQHAELASGTNDLLRGSLFFGLLAGTVGPADAAPESDGQHFTVVHADQGPLSACSGPLQQEAASLLL